MIHEYRVLHPESSDLEQVLNTWGRAGWHAITVTSAFGVPVPGRTLSVVFERPMPEQDRL